MLEVKSVNTKLCKSCDENKSEEDFYTHSSKKRDKTWLSTNCRKCHNKISTNYYGKNKARMLETTWVNHLKTKYNLTEEEYFTLLESQNYKCAICLTSKYGDNRKRFCVDHDHTTGKVRGLLCAWCNRSIGLLKDDPVIIQRAADYLRGHTNV